MQHHTMGRRAAATKENQKGSTRSYNYRRKLLIPISTLAVVLLIAWRLLRARRSSNGLERVGTIADRPIRAIDRGVGSTPVVMIRTSLDEDLHKRFLQEHLYGCVEDELNDVPELDNRVKPPVHVYEGYYHSLPTNNKIYSRNPNPLIGKDFMKPPAPPFTRAFYDAFRIVNREIFDRLASDLLEASTYNNVTRTEDVCYVLAKWIQNGRHFGDLSVQIHYGTGNEAKLVSGAAWHADAENSLLHLAVTLRGRRVLHSRRARTHANTANANSTAHLRPGVQQRQQPPKEIQEEQNPGDVYLSSSTLMRHAPRFFDTAYTTRVIAIHARILYTTGEVDHFRNVRTKDSWEKLTGVLADNLAAARLAIPSLEQVEERLALLS